MLPADGPVFGLGIVRSSFFTGMVPAHREIEITAEFIPFSVIRTYVEAPRPIGIDRTGNREVYIIVDKPVVTSVPQVESPHTFFTVSRHNNSRGSFFGDREESERDSQRERYIFDVKIGKSRNDLFVPDHFGLAQPYVEVRMIVFVTSGIPAVFDTIYRIRHFLGQLSLDVTFALLGDDLFDKSFFCLEIIFEIQTFEFLATVLEFGFADDRTATVRKTGSISQAVFHI